MIAEQAVQHESTDASGRRRTGRWQIAAAVCITVLAVVRIVSTYHEFSQTMDEPAHVATGLQLLQDHVYKLESQHPPLSRVAVALGPWLFGSRMPEEGEMMERGNDILYAKQNHWRTLILARLGVLPFFILGCVVVWIWSSRLWGRNAALFALIAFTMLPIVLAHAALATTDMAIGAGLPLALYRLVRWVEEPVLKTAAWLGAAVGIAAGSKFTALLFLPGCAGALLILLLATGNSGIPRRLPWRSLAKQAALLTGVLYLVLCACYLFTGDPLVPASQRPHHTIDRLLGNHKILHDAAYTLIEAPIPGSEVYYGALSAYLHNKGGHTAFFLGQWSRSGWWYYFPLLLLVKTPAAFLLLPGAGAYFLLRSPQTRRNWKALAPATFAAAILVLVIPSHINIGLRHILPIFPLLAMVAGYGVSQLWDRSGRYRSAGIALLLWLSVASLWAHPNYLAYFNEFVRHPERIEVDSDFDWGQDLDRLARWLRAHDVHDVSISYFGSADLRYAGLPPFRELEPNQPVRGWVAISAYNRLLPSPFGIKRFRNVPTYYSIPASFQSGNVQPGPFAWLAAYQPVARVGNSIFVYYIK